VFKALSRPSQPIIVILSAITTFIAISGLFPLLLLEHTRSIRPSDLVVVYLLVSVACDAAALWQKFVNQAAVHQNFLGLFPAIAGISVKFGLIVAESQRKDLISQGTWDQWAPEQLVCIVNRTFLWWINSILAKGQHDILTEDSLPPLDHRLASRLLRHRASKAWDKRGTAIIQYM
jgi:ATP-binding cassette subfamily C (CFTR/MRP) protein 1